MHSSMQKESDSYWAEAPAIVIRETDNKGRGVFAARFIPMHSLIEACPVIPLSRRDTLKVEETALGDYTFEWVAADEPGGENGVCVAIVLGHGSLYNHNASPNVLFTINKGDNTMIYSALSDITEGEELFIDYGIDLWFHERK